MSVDNKADDVLTVDELAARLKVPASWVYSHADGLRAYRLGKYIRFARRSNRRPYTAMSRA
jgi:excisionase family DNA binding protein